LLIKDFVKLVFLAGLLSVPTSYFFMDEWMNNFAYRVGIRPVWFVTGFLIAMIIAVATVMAQAYKAVRSNPVDAIKYE
jgi:putative ABC transport system permease protein